VQILQASRLGGGSENLDSLSESELPHALSLGQAALPGVPVMDRGLVRLLRRALSAFDVELSPMP
jgi:hypothetical protein